MKEMTVIIHGWSDCSESFKQLKKYLVAKGFGTVKTVLYADYESREDHMTFEDIVDGLNDQFIKQGIIGEDGAKKAKVNIICHSTGGLVIRHWIWRYYSENAHCDGDIAGCPVQKIIMLAPANFGSHLAHRGKSFFPSLIKGRWKFGDFLETGKRILDGLELGSPYQWRLAHGDLICKKPYFNRGGIQITILVGIEGYGGVAQAVNKPGTDGTVIIAGTSLDSAKLRLDFSKPAPSQPSADYVPYRWAVDDPKGDFAFAVLEGLDHGSVVKECSNPEKLVCGLLTEALAVKTPKEFAAFIDKTEAVTKETYRKTAKPQFQQFLVHALDDQGAPVNDFTLDFFIWKADSSVKGNLVARDRLSRRELEFSELANRILTASFHRHTVEPSHRSFVVNLDDIKRLLADARKEFQVPIVLSMRMLVPRIDEGIQYDVRCLQNIVLYHSDKKDGSVPSFFFENTTTLLELKVNRFNSYVTVGLQPLKH